ncbi:Phox homologous domain-containing protein [Pyronema omphalodes]|nr:Phox homologous domain-containing protein [Pyronema omphalodes]
MSPTPTNRTPSFPASLSNALKRRSTSSSTVSRNSVHSVISTTSHTSSNLGELQHLPPIPITLEDHTEIPGKLTAGLWARSAAVVDYTVVEGTGSRLGGFGGLAAGRGISRGAFVSWTCEIVTFEGARFTVRKRYASFYQLRIALKATFPRSVQYLPALPPKSLISKFRPKFLETRRQGLSYFLESVLLNPEFAGSPIVKDFLLHSDN